MNIKLLSINNKKYSNLRQIFNNNINNIYKPELIKNTIKNHAVLILTIILTTILTSYGLLTTSNNCLLYTVATIFTGVILDTIINIKASTFTNFGEDMAEIGEMIVKNCKEYKWDYNNNFILESSIKNIALYNSFMAMSAGHHDISDVNYAAIAGTFL